MSPDQADTPGGDRYELLRRLRRSERRIRAIRRRWRAFREDPDPATLARVRRQLDRAGDELDRLARALAGPPGREREGPATAAASPGTAGARPTPRDLVEAGRELEAAVGEALRAWAGTRRAPEVGPIERLIRHLDEAASHAGTLTAALESLDTRAGSGDEGAVEKAPAPAPRRDPPEIRAATTLDGLLAELRAEWAEIRKHPTPTRAAALAETIEAARVQASSLRTLAASDSPLSDPDALRYLGGAGDAVRFRPYRDEATGAYNGAGFQMAAGVELDRCRRYRRPLGLVLLTLDPRQTDRLRPVLGSIRSLLRSYDVVGRVGTTELALGLPESDGRGTRRIAARLLRALDEAGHRGAVTGLDYAVAPDDGATVEALLAATRHPRT
jgi:hypothetical protein